MQLVIYKPLEGEDFRRKVEYDKQRDICNRYTLEELLDWKNLDLYFILGLDCMRDCDIPFSVLKFVYHKQTMKYHPDASKYPQEALFAVQKSYKILSDPVQRRKYDSIHLDESIPEDREYEAKEFLEVFSKTFLRNAKFSNIQPVPGIGTEKSPKSEILKFYNFWQSFDSWRSFELLYEEDDAMSRSERRHMEKGNKKSLEKRKKEDILRVKKLVDVAIRRDPRLNYRRSEDPGVKKEYLTDGWTTDDISLLIKLLKETKVGQKGRLDTVVRKFNDKTAKKRSFKEIFIKYNQVNRDLR